MASPHYLASEAGLHALRTGGTAVDAAVATNAALAVVAAHSCGLGGDAFWLIWDGQAAHGLNGSGRSAQGASLEGAAATGLTEMPLRGPWTVTVPGGVHAWAEAHARFGRLPWPELLAPAIELADGFAATDGWVGAIERSAAIFGEDGEWAQTFRSHGRAWRVGEVVRLPRLAGTLRRLAEEGPSSAYTGALAQRAVSYLTAKGSPLRAEDFAGHASDWVSPVSVGYRDGFASMTLPPNSSGLAALELLKVLEHFPPPAADAFRPDGVADARWVHLALEAARRALATRDSWLTDISHMPEDVVGGYLAAERIAAVAASIDVERATDIGVTASPAGGGTIFLATGDGEGRLVSLIQSNYAGFGSGLVDPQTGISYQNRGAFFRFDARHVNALAPHKRTMHTLTPGLLFRDGRAWIAHGQMGGEIQPQIFAQFVSAVVDGGLDIASALAAPRWAALMPGHMQPPSITALESRYGRPVVEELRRRGHDVQLLEPFSSSFGHAQAVELVPTDLPDSQPSLAAAADPRAEGAGLAW